MRKSKLFVLLTFSFLNIFGFGKENAKNMDIDVESGLNLLVNFKHDEEKEKIKLGYDFDLLRLNLIFKNIDLKTGTIIKSKRDNILKPDMKDDKLKSHDFVSKIYLDYTTPEFKGFKLINNFEYYLGDFSKNAEFIDKDGKTNALGNILLKSNLKGNYLKTDLDFLVEYKANQIIDFTKDESYIKSKLDIKNELVKFKYKGAYDLNFSNKKFDPFDTKLNEFPDTLGGNYVHKVDNAFELKLNDKGEKINLEAKVDVNTLMLAQENTKFKLAAIYDYINPKFDVYYKKKFLDTLTVIPKLKNEFMFKYSQYLPETKRQMYKKSLLAYYKPGMELGLQYVKEISKDMKLDNTVNLGYDLTTNIYPYVSKTENVVHETYLNNKTDFSYKVNDKLDLKLKTDINTNLKIAKNRLKPSSDKLNLDFNLKYQFNDKLNLEYELKNKFEMTSKERFLHPTDFKENLNSNLKVNYTFFDKKDKEKLSLDNKLYGNIKGEFNYYAKSGNNKSEDFKIIYLGNIMATSLIYELGLENKLSYFKNISPKFDLETGLKLDSKLVALSVTKERLATYKTREIKDKNKGKSLPETSDYRARKYNIGGHVKLNPYVNLKYNIVEKLFLNFGVDLGINVERKVINLVKDDKRPDNGAYSYMDKNFGLKDGNLKFELGLKYKW